MADRKSLSKRTRFEIFKRDDFQCRYCGARSPSVVLHVDHIVPVCDGGSNEEGNLVTACEGCNLGKGPVGLEKRTPPTREDADTQLIERAEQVRAYTDAMSEWIAARDDFKEQLSLAIYQELWAHELPERTLPDASAKSAMKFVDKLGYRTLIELANEVGSKSEKFRDFHHAWRYYCGCCWRRIKEQDGGDF